MAGFTIGIMIRNRIASLPHPSFSAASSNSLGIPRKNWTIRKIKNAPPKNQGRTRAVLVSMRCSFFSIIYWGTTITCCGIIMVSITHPNQNTENLNLILESA